MTRLEGQLHDSIVQTLEGRVQHLEELLEHAQHIAKDNEDIALRCMAKLTEMGVVDLSFALPDVSGRESKVKLEVVR